MKPYLALFALFILSASSCVKDRVQNAATGPVVVGDRKLIHYWSFNTGADSASLAVPDTSIGGGHITFTYFANGYTDAVSPGCTLNLRRGADSGTGLRVRNPFSSWVLHIPTTGYKQPIIQFAVQKSNSGPSSNAISYTIDGHNYISAGLAASSVTLTISWTQYSLDFSGIPEVNDNPNFAIKFSNSIADTLGGNNRYDNISVDAFAK